MWKLYCLELVILLECVVNVKYEGNLVYECKGRMKVKGVCYISDILIELCWVKLKVRKELKGMSVVIMYRK